MSHQVLDIVNIHPNHFAIDARLYAPSQKQRAYQGVFSEGAFSPLSKNVNEE